MIRPAFAALLSLILLQTPQVLRVDVQLQQIIASVRDGEGRLVKDLHSDDFILEEDGVQQSIAHFTQDAETPVSLGILIDESGSMGLETGGLTSLRAAEGSTRVLLRLMKRGDEFALMSFSNGFAVRQRFTADPARIESALTLLKPEGGTNLFDAVRDGMKELKKSKYRKRALILITDAYANGNTEKLRRDIQDAEVQIYTFVIRSASESVQYPTVVRPGQSNAPGRTAAQDPSDPILELLAQESGGQSKIFEMHSPGVVDQMISFVEDIAAELKGQYTIGYYPANGGDINKHSVRLRTASPQYHARIHRELLRP